MPACFVVRETFYDDMQQQMDKLSTTDVLFIAVDFNFRVERDSSTQSGAVAPAGEHTINTFRV